ncbi:MAG: ferritin-like protein [Sphingobacteriales bacterium]
MKASFGQSNNPKRQKLIKMVPASGKADSLLGEVAFLQLQEIESPVKTLDELKSALQTAIELEHSTIPPYLCALYSIKDGTNDIATGIIRSIVVEEMLHMILAANILNAIGGTPKIDKEHFIPAYPGSLPDSDNSFIINLMKFSKESVEVFLRIEKPEPTREHPKVKDYHTIGQFYQGLMLGIEYVNDHTEGGIFLTGPEVQKRQITPEHYYGSGGVIVPVYTIDDARLAIEEIVGQGEGIDDTIEDSDQKLFGQGIEYAHYFRFNEVLQERMYCENDTPKGGPTGEKITVDWDAVHNMVTSPKVKEYEGFPELYEKARSFNQTYTQLLDNIHCACDGKPELLMKGIGLMYQLKYKAVELMNIPFKDGYMAGPTFELDRG